MARKNPLPIITHTEIYARAIRTVEEEIAVWERRCEGLPDAADRVAAATANAQEKLDALKALYRIECGSDYN